MDALAPGPSTLFIDNEAALHMINERRPTPRARHVEVQYFAVQEWRRNGDIIMRHLQGVNNPSDGLTKALSTILHHRHSRRSMGHYQPVSIEGSAASLLEPHARAGANEAGEGVGAVFGRTTESRESGTAGVMFGRTTESRESGTADVVLDSDE